jgi:methylase of polypeptide subunit release factors
VGAHEWRKKGVEVPALGAAATTASIRITACFRRCAASMCSWWRRRRCHSSTLAFDIGVGTGVLSAVLAHRGVQRVVATDQDPRALACARDNLQRLGLQAQVEVVQADLFPDWALRQAPLIVCNPPWVPARASSPGRARGVRRGQPHAARLSGRAGSAPGAAGEGWLMLSDLAEHLGLRPREQLLGWMPRPASRCWAGGRAPAPPQGRPMPATRCTRPVRRKSPRCGAWGHRQQS